MQPIQEVNEHSSEVVPKEKSLKDASTNTIGGILRHGPSTDGYIHNSNLYITPSRNDHQPAPVSPFSCPNFQGNIVFQSATPTAPPLPTQSPFDAYIANEASNFPDSLLYHLQPPWNNEEYVNKRHMLRRSPVTYDIKILSNDEPEVIKPDRLNRGSTKSHSSSNISFLPYQAMFDSEKEFHTTYHSGLRSNLDSRLSSSDGSLASSLSRSENNRYIIPPSRFVDLLDLQTVICDPFLHNQNENRFHDGGTKNSAR